MESFLNGLLWGAVGTFLFSCGVALLYLVMYLWGGLGKTGTVPHGIGLSQETYEALMKYKRAKEHWEGKMGSGGHYSDGHGGGGDQSMFRVEDVMTGLSGWEDTKTPGVGDESLPDSWGAYRVSVALNTAHRHLPGDFVRRDTTGNMVLMSREDYLRLVERIRKAEGNA